MMTETNISPLPADAVVYMGADRGWTPISALTPFELELALMVSDAMGEPLEVAQITRPQRLKLDHGYRLAEVVRPFVDARMVSPAGAIVRVDSCGSVSVVTR